MQMQAGHAGVTGKVVFGVSREDHSYAACGCKIFCCEVEDFPVGEAGRSMSCSVSAFFRSLKGVVEIWRVGENKVVFRARARGTLTRVGHSRNTRLRNQGREVFKRGVVSMQDIAPWGVSEIYSSFRRRRLIDIYGIDADGTGTYGFILLTDMPGHCRATRRAGDWGYALLICSATTFRGHNSIYCLWTWNSLRHR